MPASQLNDKWFRFLGIPLVALMGHLIFYNRNEAGDQRFGFWTIYFLSLAETMLLWEANRVVIKYSRKKYPALNQTRKRVLLLLLTCITVTIIVRTANIFLYDATNFWGSRFPAEAYLKGIFVALLFVIIVVGSYEAIYYFSKWKHVAVEAEALKKENLQTQFNSLKMQLSPHFLFNSLGSLETLIDEDPQTARRFVGEMSSVYRYLLQANEYQLTSVRNEINFITAYIGMLKIRFGEGLRVVINVEESVMDRLIPPLTLQILVENAVKHNAVLSARPLLVNIYSDYDKLIIENNLQKKISAVSSNKKGLANIISKYKLLEEPEIDITETDSKFRVVIPLIKKK
jgi:hypothetical protein